MNSKLLSKYAAYVLPIMLIFIVATIEYNLETAVNLVLKLIAFCLSMLLPIILSARVSTFSFSDSNSPSRFLRTDLSSFIFCAIQTVLWGMGMHQLQLYIIGVAIALFVVVLFIFLAIRYFG